MMGPELFGLHCGSMHGGCSCRFGPRESNTGFDRHSVHHGCHPFQFGHHPFGHHHMFGGHRRYHPFAHDFGRHPFDLDRSGCRCKNKSRKWNRKNRRNCNSDEECEDCDFNEENSRRTNCEKINSQHEENNATEVEEEERGPFGPERMFLRRGGMRGGRCRRTRVTCSRRCKASGNKETQDRSSGIQVQRIIVENEPRSNSA